MEPWSALGTIDKDAASPPEPFCALTSHGVRNDECLGMIVPGRELELADLAQARQLFRS
jgi:hypothetical protein